LSVTVLPGVRQIGEASLPRGIELVRARPRPALQIAADADPDLPFAEYIQTHSEWDSRQLSAAISLPDFRCVTMLAVQRTGGRRHGDFTVSMREPVAPEAHNCFFVEGLHEH
jgi:hypothetical protein